MEEFLGRKNSSNLSDQENNSVSWKTKNGLNCPPLLCFNVILSQSHRTQMDLLIIYTSKNGLVQFF